MSTITAEVQAHKLQENVTVRVDLAEPIRVDSNEITWEIRAFRFSFTRYAERGQMRSWELHEVKSVGSNVLSSGRLGQKEPHWRLHPADRGLRDVWTAKAWAADVWPFAADAALDAVLGVAAEIELSR